MRPLPPPIDAVSMIRAANWLAAEAATARRDKRHTVGLPVATAERLADALLEAVNRQGIPIDFPLNRV